MDCTCTKNNIEHYNNFELKNFNTAKVSTLADDVYFIHSEADFLSIIRNIKNPIIIGAGSNTLLSSSGIKNPVIITKKMSEISIRKDMVEVQAGASVQKLSLEAKENHLSGFEFLIGLPATLGGAVAMNAGAHGQTISDNIISARIYDMEKGEILTFGKDELEFSYRNSIIKKNPKRYIVLGASFKLEKKEKDLIEQKMQENTEFRKKVQPSLALPNLGSTFKNPKTKDGEPISAGLLIDKCNLKGFSIGGAKVWENHANFVINFNNATSKDYTDVIFTMYSKVKEKFDIELEPEIVRIGDFTPYEDEKWKIMKKN